MATDYLTNNTNDDERGLTVVPSPPAGMVMPIATAQEARAAIEAYERLKSAIIMDSDLQRIGSKQHVKKSGWLRIARAFGLTVEPVSERYETTEDGAFGYAIVVRAVAPNGASMQGDGMCWSSEKAAAQRTRHNVRAHAYTRATNRAISNLVGGGEVSAEEMQDYREDEDEAATRPAKAVQWNALQDGDVRLKLQQLGLISEDEKRAKLATIHADMKRTGEPWTKPGVLKRLALAPGGHGHESLADLDAGTRGN